MKFPTPRLPKDGADWYILICCLLEGATIGLMLATGPTTSLVITSMWVPLMILEVVLDNSIKHAAAEYEKSAEEYMRKGQELFDRCDVHLRNALDLVEEVKKEKGSDEG